VHLVGELMKLIQAHLDRYGVSRAEFARRAGTTPQTVQNWKDRPRTLPKAHHLRGVANVIGLPYETVLKAAMIDAGYSPNDSEPVTPRTALRSSVARAKLKIDDGDQGREQA
jgi:transcriptional regulator with XRE-family HTH domain